MHEDRVRKNGGRAGGDHDPRAEPPQRGMLRDHASRHSGLIVVAPVFWAAFAVFLQPVGGVAGFGLHVMLLGPRQARRLLFLTGAFLVLALWFAARAPHVSLEGAPFHRTFVAEGLSGVRMWTGTVVTVPTSTARGYTFLFREARADGRRALLYRVALEQTSPPEWGATISLHGEAVPAEPPPNPGQLDMRRVLRGQGASAILEAGAWRAVKPPPAWKRVLTQVRRHLAQSLTRHVPAAARPLLEASLLNLTANIPDETRDAFLRSGMQHILAISGQHIGLLLGFLLLAGLCARLPRKLTFLIAGLLTAAYIPLVGSPVSVVRSGIMFACLLPAIVLERPTAGAHALGLTASVDLLMDPHNILNLGFQLSYAATLALILGAQPAQHAAHTLVQHLFTAPTALVRLARRLHPHRDREGAGDPDGDPEMTPRAGRRGSRLATILTATGHMVILSALVTLYTYPALAVSTHATTPWGILGNVATVPVGAAMLTGGLFVWSFDFLLPGAMDPLASAAGAAAGLCALFLEAQVFFLAGLPGALKPVAHASPGWVAALMLAGALVTWCLRRRLYLPALLWGAATFGAEAARPLVVNAWTGLPRVTFLAVGHGDAAVVELPGATILIDAGDAPRVTRNIILPYLQFRGLSRLDAVVITHGDRDHYGGVAALLQRVPVGRIIAPPERGEAPASATWDCVKQVARHRGVPWMTGHAGQRLYTGPRDTLWVVAPDTSHAALAGADKNDLSLVTLLRTSRHDILFTGDIEQAGQEALSASWPLWRGAWLKVPHHGSDRTTAPCFLRAAAAPRAVVSCGGRRGFPGSRVMQTLEEAGTATAVTKRHGAVTWTFPRNPASVRESRHLDAASPPSPFLNELLN